MGGRASMVRVNGPLAPYAAGFRWELVRLGYRPKPVCDQLRLLAHASRWLAGQGLGAEALTPMRVDEFLSRRRAEGYTLWLSPKAMTPMLDYLRRSWRGPAPGCGVGDHRGRGTRGVLSGLLGARARPGGRHDRWLLARGSAVLRGAAVDGELHLDRLQAAEVTDYVLGECASRSVGSAKYIVCGLRSLLRYLYVAGRIAHPAGCRRAQGGGLSRSHWCAGNPRPRRGGAVVGQL